MKKIQKTTLIILAILLTSNVLFGQIRELSLDQKINNSEIIVEGKVIERNSFFDEKTKHIYTNFKIETFKVLKGQSRNEIIICEIGGFINGRFENYEYTNQYNVGDYGLFFCTKSKQFNSIYETYGGIQGFIRINNEKLFQTAVTSFVDYNDLGKTLFLPIEKLSNQKPIRIKPNPREQLIINHLTSNNISGNYFTSNAIEYYLENANAVLGISNYIEFDIFVKVNASNFDLADAEINIIYDTLTFGSNIAGSNNITVTKGTVLLSPDYSINVSDLNLDEFNLDISTLLNPNNLFNIGTTPELLCHVKLDIQNIASMPFLNFDDATMQNLSNYYDYISSTQVPFQQVVANDTIMTPLQTTAVMSISPDTIPAGGNYYINIIGSGFGATQGNGKVEFSKLITDPISWVEPLPIDYVSWNDTLIQVVVPSCHKGAANASSGYTAATGPIRVWSNGSSSPSTSNTSLYITYSLKNIYSSALNGNYNIIHRDLNSAGGIVLEYDSDMKDTLGATAAFERALVKWRCATGINFVIDSTLSNSTMVCPVEFATLPANTAGQGGTIGALQACYNNSNSYIETYSAEGVTMRYDNATTSWYTGTSPNVPTGMFDMERTTLHEMGHMHLLRHVNNIDDLMFPAYPTSNPIDRIITRFAVDGGNDNMSYNMAQHGSLGNCGSEMLYFNQAGCDTIIWNSTNDLNTYNPKLTCYPNPTSANINLQFTLDKNYKKAEIEIINQVGQNVIPLILLENCGKGINDKEINLSPLANGLYFATLKLDNIRSTIKIIKQ